MFSILLFLKNRNVLSRGLKENKLFLFHREFKQYNGGKKELHEHLILFEKHQIAIFYTCIHLYTVIVSKCLLFCFFISLICYQYFLFDWTTWNWHFYCQKWSDTSNFIWFNIHVRKLNLYTFPLKMRKNHPQYCFKQLEVTLKICTI